MPPVGTPRGAVNFWNRVSFPHKLWNSVFISGMVSILAIIVSVLNAYPPGIGRVKARLGIIVLFLLANMVPQGALLHPLCSMFKDPDAGVFRRGTGFGQLSSHSRSHGSSSYRVPWVFDDEAVEVTRTFTRLKLSLMPYLYAAGLQATRTGTPVLRPMQLEFGDDPATGYLDRQYLLGADLLVAPVFNSAGDVEFYLPAGTWTNYFTDQRVDGPCWRRETHGFQSIPLYVRDGAVLVVGGRDDRPDYDYLDGLTLVLYPCSLPGDREGSHQVNQITVTTPAGASAVFTIERKNGRARISSPSVSTWSVRVSGGRTVTTTTGEAEVTL